MKNQKNTLILLLVMLWILLVLGGYYYYHKPISLDMIAPPISAALDVIFTLGFAGLAGGIGRRLLRAAEISGLEQAAVQFTLGASAISLAWLALGLAGAYRFPISAPLLILGLLLLRKDALAWYRAFGELGAAWRQSKTLERFLVLVAAILLLYQLTIALSPAIKWDALTYHLQLPRQYLDAGAFIFVPENPYWGHPQLVELLYTFAMGFHGAQTAAALGWSFSVIFLLGLVGLVNRQLARIQSAQTPAYTAGWIAAVAVTAGYTFRYLAGWAYTDLFSALAGLAALIAFFTWIDSRKAAWFLWASLFAGLAMGTKWTSGVLALGLFAVALLHRRRLDLSWKHWLLGGGIVLAAVAPWLIKNMLVTGSPVYPYFIETKYISAARMADDPFAVLSMEWWQFALLPIATTWTGVDSAPGFGADLGPLLLLFALPGFWVYRREVKAQAAALFLIPAGLAMLAAALGYIHLLQTRLYYVLLACLAVPAGWGWEWLQRQVLQGVRLRRILSAVLVLVLALIFWQDTYFMGKLTPLRHILGTQTTQAYLENSVGWHIRAMQTLEGLPSESRILMLWEPRGLYAPANAQADLWIDRWRSDRRELQTAPAIMASWQEQGYTHILIYRPGMDMFRPEEGASAVPSPNWTVLQDLLRSLDAPQEIGETYWLYQIP